MKHLFVAILLLISISTFALEKDWFNNEQEAKSYAKENNVSLLMVFAGSDWCRPCMAFKNTILLSEQFNDYSKGHVAVLYLDFPMQSKNKLSKELTAQNEKLAAKYNPSGFFPNILLIDADGKSIGNIKFKNQSPESFIESCEALLKK